MKYAGKKLLSMLATLLGVSFLVFFAFDVIPGDPALAQLGTNATPERLEALREEMGLNAPFFQRYFQWIAAFFTGDFGTSYSYHIPVGDMILEKLPISVFMTLMAFVMVLVISIPLGILSAKHEGGKLDTVICTVNQVLMSVPPFFSGMLITLLFGIVLRWFTPGGFVSLEQDAGAFFGYLFFPALAIALPKAAMAVKMLRSSLVTELGKDYPRTAYSRGNTKNQVLRNHVLKNALIPVLTFFGMALTDILTGSIIVEQVFGIPGLGRILLTSIMNRDYPVVEAIIMFMAIIVIVVNFLVDLLYRRLDPQINME
ncbi:MAG: ABC transporter permease [Ruminococcus sp.]|nr:ABC transporter permease [Ruminococcus sp.]